MARAKFDATPQLTWDPTTNQWVDGLQHSGGQAQGWDPGKQQFTNGGGPDQILDPISGQWVDASAAKGYTAQGAREAGIYTYDPTAYGGRKDTQYQGSDGEFHVLSGTSAAAQDQNRFRSMAAQQLAAPKIDRTKIDESGRAMGTAYKYLSNAAQGVDSQADALGRQQTADALNAQQSIAGSARGGAMAHAAALRRAGQGAGQLGARIGQQTYGAKADEMATARGAAFDAVTSKRDQNLGLATTQERLEMQQREANSQRELNYEGMSKEVGDAALRGFQGDAAAAQKASADASAQQRVADQQSRQNTRDITNTGLGGAQGLSQGYARSQANTTSDYRAKVDVRPVILSDVRTKMPGDEAPTSTQRRAAKVSKPWQDSPENAAMRGALARSESSAPTSYLVGDYSAQGFDLGMTDDGRAAFTRLADDDARRKKHARDDIPMPDPIKDEGAPKGDGKDEGAKGKAGGGGVKTPAGRKVLRMSPEALKMAADKMMADMREQMEAPHTPAVQDALARSSVPVDLSHSSATAATATPSMPYAAVGPSTPAPAAAPAAYYPQRDTFTSDVRAKSSGDAMQSANRSMVPSEYEYRPEFTPPGQAPHEKNVGPMAQNMAADPVARTAIVKGDNGMLAIDKDKGLKLVMGGLASLQHQVDQLSRPKKERR